MPFDAMPMVHPEGFEPEEAENDSQNIDISAWSSQEREMYAIGMQALNAPQQAMVFDAIRRVNGALSSMVGPFAPQAFAASQHLDARLLRGIVQGGIREGVHRASHDVQTSGNPERFSAFAQMAGLTEEHRSVMRSFLEAIANHVRDQARSGTVFSLQTGRGGELAQNAEAITNFVRQSGLLQTLLADPHVRRQGLQSLLNMLRGRRG